MKKLMTAMMLAALASGTALLTESSSLAAMTHGPAKARHSIVTRARRKPGVSKSAKAPSAKATKARATHKKARKSTRKSTKKATKSNMPHKRKASGKRKVRVGKIVRAHKSRGRKAKPVNPDVNGVNGGGGTPLPISQ